MGEPLRVDYAIQGATCDVRDLRALLASYGHLSPGIVEDQLSFLLDVVEPEKGKYRGHRKTNQGHRETSQAFT